MKSIFTSLCVLFSANFIFGQTVLYTNSFDSPGGFTLDAGSGSNNWVVNNVYQGDLNFLSGTTIPNVPSQPASFTNPNQNYLHPSSPLALNMMFQPILNANYLAGGFSNVKAYMSTSIDASDYTDVTFSFWRAGGLNGMKVIYSIDGGQTWSDAGLTFQGSPTTWTEETIVINALDGQSNVRIGFEMMEAQLADPAPNPYHSIDELKITGTPVPTGEISINLSIPITGYCSGQTVTATYNVVSGTINAGNTFTLQLSDATGDFTNATVIGSVSSSQNTGTINGVLPAGLTGSNFRMRVLSSDAAITGNDNGSDFSIAASPEAPVITFNSTTGQLEVTTSAPSFEWFFFGSAVPNSLNQTSITPLMNGGYTVVATNGNCETTSDIFTVNFVGIENETLPQIHVFPNPFSGVLNIQMENNAVNQVVITDLSGKIVFTGIDINTTLELGHLNAGIYFVQVANQTFKVLKN